MDQPKKMDAVPLETVKKSLAILELLNTFPNMRISDLARSSGHSRPSVQRTLSTLIELGYVFKEESSKKYRVTNRVLNLSRGYNYSSLIASASKTFILTASQSISWPLILTRPRGMELEILATTQDQNPFALQKLSSGDRIPFFESASSRVFLACNPEHIRDSYFGILSRMDLDREGVALVKAGVNLASKRGFAFYKKHKDPEKAMAVPIMVGTCCHACLVVRFFDSALSEADAAKELLPTLVATAADIGQEIDSELAA